METVGLVIAVAGLVVALVGSAATVEILCRKGFPTAALPLLLLLVFPVAVALAWDWGKAAWQGAALVAAAFVTAAALLPLMMSRVGWLHGMKRGPYILNAVGVGLLLLGALIVTSASPAP